MSGRAFVPLMVLLAMPAPARADTPSGPGPAAAATQQAVAQALFDEARDLSASGRFADACPKFAESQRLDPAPGTLLNLADCFEKNGQTASAWATFKDARAEARRLGRADWVALAGARADALEQRLARVHVRVPPTSTSPDLEVRRDGLAIGRAEWDTALPVDPGAHTITASAPGKETWSITVRAAPGATEIVRVPTLRAAPRAAGTPEDPAPTAVNLQRPIAVGVAVVGAVGLGLGAVFGLQASSKRDEGLRACSGKVCTPDGVLLIADAKSAATVSTVTFVAGAALVAGAAVLWFTAPHDRARVGVAPGVASLHVMGSF